MPIAAAITLALGVSGLFGAWPIVGSSVIGTGVLIAPGWTVARFLGAPGARCSPGILAFALVVSTGVFNLAAAASRVSNGDLAHLLGVLSVLYILIGGLGLTASARGEKSARPDLVEWCACLLAVAVLLPTVVRYAGGAVDDWWDLAYVRALSERGSLDFREPMLGSEAVHPRFSWSAWLLIQALLHFVAGGDPIDFQTTVVAPLVCVASVGAVAGLARAVFGIDARAMSVTAVLVVPAWLYGTEALPYFTRLHQDKIAAALIFVPTLLTTTLHYARRPTLPHLLAFAVCAVATCAVHTLVFGVALIGVVLCSSAALFSATDIASSARHDAGNLRLRHFVILAGVVAAVLVFPVWQAWSLRGWFAEQGVGLAFPDNPVVRAHLALGRLLGAGEPYMIVNPAAVFGPIGILAVVGACAAARRKHRGDAYLVVLAFVPALLLFVPLVAGTVGAAVVPWMLYRVGWLIPQALLIARVLSLLWVPRSNRIVRGVGILVFGSLVAGLALPTALDRLRRGMREHPASTEARPRGTTLEVYHFLEKAGENGVVLAPAGFSNLIPALTGRPVVALSERGTLVFAGDERGAYRRMHDRSEFLACATSAAERARIAHTYGVTHAVFRRRYLTSGDETTWLERASADGVAASEDFTLPVACMTTVDALTKMLPLEWSIVLENRDYFVVETGVQNARGIADRPSVKGWHGVFDIDEASVARAADAVLGSATGYPGADVRIEPVPLGFGVSPELVWVGGGAVWDDGPFEVAVTLALENACQITGIEVVPYLETRRREVLHVEIEGKQHRFVARDGVGVFIALEPRRRREVRVEIRSLVGFSFGLSDVRVLGDRARCDDGWRPLERPRLRERPTSIRPYLSVLATYPRSPRLASGAARHRVESGSRDDAIVLLRRAIQREHRDSVAWIEMGLLLDQSGRFDEARAAYKRARDVDSNSAWAHGCLAWTALRSDAPLVALYHAWRALRLDDRYADALTLAALAIERMGSTRMSAIALERAITMAPRRAWPYLERARQLAAENRYDDARAMVRSYRRLVPDDLTAVERLRTLSHEEGRRRLR